MYPQSYYDENRYQQKPRDPLTLDIYPSKEKTQFELIEDDGVTYKFKTDRMYNKTLIECEHEENTVKINITGQHEGNGYEGMPGKRNYRLQVHGSKPQTVFIAMDKLREINDTTLFSKTPEGWYFDPGINITYIKIKSKKAKSSFSVIISRGTSY